MPASPAPGSCWRILAHPGWSAEYPDSGEPYGLLAAIDALRGDQAMAATHMARHRQLLPSDSVAYFALLNPSKDPEYLHQRARLTDGLRRAGLPEQ